MDMKTSTAIRMIALGLIVCSACAFSVTKLMSYQIVNGDDYLAEAKSTSTSSYTTTAARGDIVDRYGRILATNKSVYNVVFNYAFTERAKLNKTINSLTELMKEQGFEWNNYLPIKATDNSYESYEFEKDREKDIENMRNTIRQASYSSASDCVDKMYIRYAINTKEKITSYPIEFVDGEYQFTDVSENDIIDFKQENDLATNLSASECIAKLQEDGKLILYTEQEAFEIAQVRYSMEKMAFSVDNPYVFVGDIDNETIIKVEEMSYRLTGVGIDDQPARDYVNGEIATHLLGTVGPIYAEEYEKYKEKGYPMNSIVGKAGIESAYEEQLKGTNGEKLIIQNDSGEIVEEKVITEAKKGNTVQLTIDSVFQAKIQEILSDMVATATTNNGKYKSTGGAVVVLDIATGEVLASVTEPTYSVETYKKHYSELLEADVKNPLEKKNPLLNKALNGQYRPGSSFKPVMAVAGLQEGEISPNSLINCVSPFVYYETPYGCLQDHHSGNIDVVAALKWSCNTFFYKLADMLGLDRVNKYAEGLGLGVDTGLEIYHQDGRLTKYTDDGSWYIGKIVQAGIGQADTYVTPLQMAIEAMTIANKGKRLEAHIIDEIVDVNDKVLFETKPIVASEFDMTDSTYTAVFEGMKAAASKLTGAYDLKNLGYDVAVKTGTAQTVDNDTTNNAFIAYTPEIAIACMVENTDKGTQFLIRPILEAYAECKTLGEQHSKSDEIFEVDKMTEEDMSVKKPEDKDDTNKTE